MLLTNIISIIFVVTISTVTCLMIRQITWIMKHMNDVENHMNEVDKLFLKIFKGSRKRLEKIEEILINAANHNTDKENDKE